MKNLGLFGVVSLVCGTLSLVGFGALTRLINGSVAGWQLLAFFVLGVVLVVARNKLQQ